MTTWMNLEGMMLRKVSQTENDEYCILSLTCEIKNKNCCPGLGRNRENLVKIIGGIRSADVIIYDMVTIFENTIV